MKIHTDTIQGSDAWHELRLGKATASCFSKVLAKGAGKTRRSYLIQLAAERLSGLPQDSFSNGAMEWGTEHEPQARAVYQAIEGVSVLEVGFVEHDENIGVSPDGLVSDNGCCEYKCPNTTTHIETILSGKMPTKYTAQVQGIMWVCEREYCDFVSFDPRMTAQRYFRVRVPRDQLYIDNLKIEVDRFIVDLKEMVTKLSDNQPY